MKRIFRVVSVLVLVGGMFGAAMAQDFNWKQFDGTNIRFLMNQHPFTEFIQPLLPEFEALTGIKVTFETLPEAQFRQKRLLEVTAGTSTLDGYMVMPGQVGAQYLRAGWFKSLNDDIADPQLTAPGLDIDDFFDGAMSTFKNGDEIFGLPLQIESSLLFYRKDLLAAAGIDGPPATMDDLLADAKALNSADMAGFAMRGGGAAATSQIVNFLYSFGGKWLNDDGSSALASPESQAALEFYANLLRSYGPPGASTMSWPEVTSLFAQGKAAMIFDANVFRSIMEDPKQAIDVVRQNVGYAPLPAGPAGSVPAVLVWGLSVNNASKNPGAAWLFIQWALSKENQLKAALAGVPAARNSAWENPEFQKLAPADWVKASQTSFSSGQPDWNPPVIPVAEVRDAYGQAIVAALQGQPVGPALERAASQMDQIVKQSQ